MHPAQQLKALAARKADLRARIAARRQDAIAAAAPITGILTIVDQGIALLRSFVPSLGPRSSTAASAAPKACDVARASRP